MNTLMYTLVYILHTDVHTGEGVGVKRQIGVELQRKGGFADPA